MKKAILTLALAAVASSSMSGFVYGPVMASTTDRTPSAVQSETSHKTTTGADVQAKAEQLANAKDFAGLVRYCDEIIAANPSIPEAYFFRALATYSITDDVASVMADLGTAIALNPQYADAYMGRAIVAENQDDIESSVRDWSALLALQPDNLQALDRCLSYHALLNDLDGFEKDCTYWIALDPESADAHFYRAMTRAQRGDIANAISDLERTSQLLVAQGANDQDVQTLIAKLKSGAAIG